LSGFAGAGISSGIVILWKYYYWARPENNRIKIRGGIEMGYNIIQDPLVNRRSKEKFKPIGVLVHETAMPGATAKNIRDYFERTEREVMSHFSVDWGSIIQMVPTDEIAWHAGWTANHRYLGVELCRPYERDPQKFNEVWEKGVWLFAYLLADVLKINKVTEDNLISHYDAAVRFKDTTHTDPIGYFKEYGKTVGDFRRDVQNQINNINGGKNRMSIVIPYSVPDIGAAQVLASNIKAAVLDWALVSAEDDVYQVGGPRNSKPQKPCKSFKVISGSNRLETVEEVCKFIRQSK
jgi:N-acetylmuramoyl-L-alanine amidase